MSWRQTLIAAQRRRRLASDDRAGTWARGRARSAQRDFLREHWLLFIFFLTVVLGTAVACGFLMPSDFMRGLVLGAAIVAGPGAVWVFTLQVTGSAAVMMGDQAEQWTAQELRRLGRKGWRLVNHFALGPDDIDHVLIGPGGAFAVETKWTGSSWLSEFGRKRQHDAAAQARANARTLRLWHPFHSNHIAVAPIVVLWGQGLSGWPEEDQVRVIDGVTVVTGPALRRWTAGLGSDTLADAQISDGWAAMEAHVARRDPIEAAIHPVPTSVAEWAGRCSLAIVSAAAGLMAFGSVLDRLHAVVPTLIIAATLAAAGVVPLRFRCPPWLTWAAWAWTSVLVIASVALSVAELAYRLQ